MVGNITTNTISATKDMLMFQMILQILFLLEILQLRKISHEVIISFEFHDSYSILLMPFSKE